MKFLVIKNLDKDTLAAVVCHDSGGNIWWCAYNTTYREILRLMFSHNGLWVEDKVGPRAYVRRRVSLQDAGFLDAFKHRLSTPYVAHMSGVIQERNPETAVNRVWAMFSPSAHSEVVTL